MPVVWRPKNVTLGDTCAKELKLMWATFPSLGRLIEQVKTGKEDAMVKVDDAMRKHGECEEVEPSSTVVFAGKTKKMINVYQS